MSDQASGGAPEFELILASLSASFVNTGPDELDQRVLAALEQIGQFLEIDLLEIWLVDPSNGQYRQAYRWIPPGGTSSSNSLGAAHPYSDENLAEGETVVLSRFGEQTPSSETERDIAILKRNGVKSTVVLPLVAGNAEIGVIYFESYASDKVWPERFVVRLQLIGEIFANLFMQCDTERELQRTLQENIALRRRLESENRVLQEEVSHARESERVIGATETFSRILQQAQQVAHTESTVLLLGETGTGKDLIANHIHQLSRRAHRRLVRVNCAALPETLFESELFGHEKGAFTGAESRKIGRFELADGGTLVLDEIGEMPLHSQPKLLRALQTGEFERLGSEKTHKANVRLVASTNRNLEAMAREGSFRPDLYYRINVFPITVPPLRERKGDIPLLADYFVEKLRGQVNPMVTRISDEAMDALLAYDWPGNIRELQNVIERSLILSTGDALSADVLMKSLTSAVPAAAQPVSDHPAAMEVKTLDELNREYIRAVCEQCRWKIHGVGNAAELLGVNPNTLRARMKKLGVERPVR